jgi:hypothetical protein
VSDPVAVLTTYVAAALLAALFLTILARSLGAEPPGWITPLLGISSHAALFPLVGALPSPAWARSAGFGWLIVDVVANSMELHAGEDRSSTSIRYGGHILAGMWIAASSVHSGGLLAWLGVPLGAWLVLHALLASQLPEWALAPAMPLLIIWLIAAGVSL